MPGLGSGRMISSSLSSSSLSSSISSSLFFTTSAASGGGCAVSFPLLSRCAASADLTATGMRGAFFYVSLGAICCSSRRSLAWNKIRGAAV